MRISLEREPGREAGPVYRQIAAQIRAAVRAGGLAPGSRLPPIRSLARELAVNRDTVALAYEALAREGVVESTVGRGTFVRDTPEAAPAAPAAPAPALSPLAERLLTLERARPRFGSAEGAARLHSLVPDPALFPAQEFGRVMARTLREGGPELLLYGGPQGLPRMREVLAARLAGAGIEVGPDELVLCHGASQGISLAMRLFAGPGDAVAVEEPTYNNALAAAAALGLRVVPVPMRGGAPEPAALEGALARAEVKLFYTMPTFHNPLGTTASLEQRQELLACAARHGVPVVEDGYEVDLGFGNASPPPLAALDPGGLVVHLASFSKSLFPGVRVGAVAARGRQVDALLALKQATDLSDAMPLQAALAEFLASGAYDRHLGRLRPVLRARRDALLEALARELPTGCAVTRPEGGYQVWVELPEGWDSSELLADAVGAGVLFAPGAQFLADGRASRGLRLSLAQADEAELCRGAAALGRVLRGRARRPAERRAARVLV